MKESSKVWAEHLLERCGKGLYHDPDNQYGENLAGNSGTGSWVSFKIACVIIYLFIDIDIINPLALHCNTQYNTLGQAAVRSAENILTRFVENEENKPYPQNGHLTQVSFFCMVSLFIWINAIIWNLHSCHCRFCTEPVST